MTLYEAPAWNYPGRHLDADERDVDAWPRHKARQRRRKRVRSSLRRRSANRQDT